MSRTMPLGFSESVIIPKSLLEKYCSSLLKANYTESSEGAILPLVPEEATVFLENPPVGSGKHFQERKQNILNDPALDSETKLKLYNQHKRLHYQSQKKPLLVETRKEAAAGTAVNKIEKQKDISSITQLFPEKNQPFVANILQKILENQDLISWNEKQEVIISGTKIVESNIIDLMRYVMDGTIITNESDLPPGAALFVQALEDIKIPFSWLKLKRRSGRKISPWINY